MRGSITAAHITRERILLLDGGVTQGELHVQNAVCIPMASRFFGEDGRVTQLAGMVEAIADAVRNNAMSRSVSVCYDNGLEVIFDLDPTLSARRKAQIKSGILGKKADKEDKSPAKKAKNIVDPVIKHTHYWGSFLTEDEQGEMKTVCAAERDLVSAMGALFREQGMKLLSFEPPETALMYFRQYVPFSYDSVCKMVLWADNDRNAQLFSFTKDVPALVKRISLDAFAGGTTDERVVDCLSREAASGHMRRPKVFLVGDLFSDSELYRNVRDKLVPASIDVLDVYGAWEDWRPPFEALQFVFGERLVREDLCGSYGICVGLLLRTQEAKPEDLQDGSQAGFLSGKLVMQLSKAAAAAAVFILAATVIYAGIPAVSLVRSTGKLSDTTALQQYMAVATQARTNAEQRLAALNTLDDRYTEIIRFIYNNIDATMNICSVDTADMLPTAEATVDGYPVPAADGTATVPVDPGAVPADPNAAAPVPAIAAYQPKQIVVRGYSTVSDGPVSLYNALVKAGVGEVRLSGVQQMQLDNGESLFAFELTAGN